MLRIIYILYCLSLLILLEHVFIILARVKIITKKIFSSKKRERYFIITDYDRFLLLAYKIITKKSIYIKNIHRNKKNSLKNFFFKLFFRFAFEPFLISLAIFSCLVQKIIYFFSPFFFLLFWPGLYCFEPEKLV